LIVEDDQVDFSIIRRALKEIGVVNPVAHVEDGEQALAYLRNPESVKPCIILLDLNMPNMNGIEFLQEAKNDERLRHFPVIVLTTSEEEHDKARSFNLSVAGYMTKPLEYRKFVEVMRSIDCYWSISELPN
jgi:CheY-like chemotaxis protein